MIFKRSDLPLDEDQFQSLLSMGLIKQKGSEQEKLCKILGMPYKPDPNEIPYFDVDKSIIIELLGKCAFDPTLAETIVLDTDIFFGNQFSQEIHVRHTSIYSKFLYNNLITEIGFSFHTNSLIQLQNSLNNSEVENDGNQKERIAYVPFFITTWDERKEAYHYTSLDMTHFESWLKLHFAHINTPHAIDVLLNAYQTMIYMDNNQIINSDIIEEVITHIRSQLVHAQRDNSEQNNENLVPPTELRY